MEDKPVAATIISEVRASLDASDKQHMLTTLAQNEAMDSRFLRALARKETAFVLAAGTVALAGYKLYSQRATAEVTADELTEQIFPGEDDARRQTVQRAIRFVRGKVEWVGQNGKRSSFARYILGLVQDHQAKPESFDAAPQPGQRIISWEQLMDNPDRACRDHSDTFGDFDDKTANEKAKKICNGCPINNDCYEYGVRNPFAAGVWGGADESERKKEHKKRRTTKAARNRKD